MEDKIPAKDKRRRHNRLISIFVILWTVIFHYESTRHFYLDPFFGRPLPKVRFLFPPAGWIMFYHVDDSYGLAEIYRLNGTDAQFIDPHAIFETKAVLYDNIHRNVLSTVLSPYYQQDICRFLKRKFPDSPEFLIAAVYYPSVTKTPQKKLYRIDYICR